MFYCWENLSKLLPERKFLTTKIFHFPLKIFVSSKILEEFAIFEDLRRIFELTKILRIRLRFIFRNRRIFVFVFGPFSIFVATLIPNINTVLYYTMQADTRKGGVIWVQIRSDIRNRPK